MVGGKANEIPLSWSSVGTLSQYGVLLEQTMRPESSYNTISDRSIYAHIYLNSAKESRCMVLINDSAHHA